MRFGHSSAWRIFILFLFSIFYYYYISIIFYKHPISLAYGNAVGETYAEVATYLIGATEAVGLVVEARAAFHPYHRT